MRPARTPAVARVVALAGLLAAVGVAVPAGPAAADEVDCSAYAVDDPRRQTSAPSLPVQSLDVAAAQALAAGDGGAPGQGVRVAVVDSGVTTMPSRGARSPPAALSSITSS